MLHHLTQTFGDDNDRYFFGSGSKLKKLEERDVTLSWSLYGRSCLGYGPGTDGEGISVSNSSDGKEHGACAAERVGVRDNSNEIID